MLDYAWVALGLVLLVGGAEVLIRGAATVAERLGVSTFLIGLTLVAFGTSLPELVACIQAGLIGSPDLAMGNIVGSNIANTLLILGCAALVAPLIIPTKILRRDGMFVLVCSILFFVVAVTAPIDQTVGAFFLLLLAVYLFSAHRNDKFHTSSEPLSADSDDALDDDAEAIPTLSGQPLVWALLLAVAGLVAVVFGGRLLVDSASNIARVWGVSETVIGLTLLAIGTSLPELATTMLAAFRQHTEMALGNVLGSNIYNILGVGGVMGFVAPTSVPQELIDVDIYVMIFSVVALLIFGLFSNFFTRVMGLSFLAAYAGYLMTL